MVIDPAVQVATVVALVQVAALVPQETQAPETKKYPPEQAVAYQVAEQVNELDEQATHPPLVK